MKKNTKGCVPVVTVDAHALCYVETPGVEEKLVLDLACALEAKKNPRYVCVSWASQVEAANYFNQEGFVAALDRLMALERESEGGETR
jgi:hypothetical protein